MFTYLHVNICVHAYFKHHPCGYLMLLCNSPLTLHICCATEELDELRKKEKEMGYTPDWELDAFMKAEIRKGKKESIVTDLVIKLLGLDVCSETLIGNDQIRGVSGGQRKRVTTGELLVSPKKTLFLDEISTGLDSATTFQIMRTLCHFAHLRQATMLIALLQPTPEVYHLFDDIMLLSEGVCAFPLLCLPTLL